MTCPLLEEPFPSSVFVTGTGTDVGKTVASAVLCALWEAEYWKPVQTGEHGHDTLEVLRLSPGTPVHLPAMLLKEPASPHLAACREGVEIRVEELIEVRPEAWCLVAEGAGGALVPLGPSEDTSDLIRALDLPVVVVASTGLGTLHHTLSTLESLRARGLRVAGVLLTGPAHGDNARELRDRGRTTILGRVPPMFPLDAQAVAELVVGWRLGRWIDPCDEPTPDATEVDPGPLAARDARVAWHPYTQHQGMLPPLEVVSARGAVLALRDGGEMLDAISSWWVTNHGHGHPVLARAVAEQARRLEQVIFAGCTHEPAVRLAERLLPLLPGEMGRLFWSDDGSTAVEVAIKACVQRAVRRGVARPRVAALQDAYHGDTFGTMSAGERSVFTAPFDPYLFEVDRLPTPAGTWDPESDAGAAAAERSLSALREWASCHAGDAACLVVEPRVQGSAGMRMYGRAWLEAMDGICREAGIPWVADEVFTGFGRAGALFACSPEAGRPDLSPAAVCLSKGLTGGFVPMGATAFREDIFQVFLDDDRSRTFFHGHSFTANPIGCAAALASLDLCLAPETTRAWERLGAWHRTALEDLEARHGTTGSRVLGTIAAFELPGAPKGYLAQRGQIVARACRERGVLVRPLGDTLYVVPPYCLRGSEHERIFAALDEAIASL